MHDKLSVILATSGGREACMSVAASAQSPEAREIATATLMVLDKLGNEASFQESQLEAAGKKRLQGDSNKPQFLMSGSEKREAALRREQRQISEGVDLVGIGGEHAQLLKTVAALATSGNLQMMWNGPPWESGSKNKVSKWLGT